MSVVNKMLQDLEQRDEGAGGESADYQPPGSSGSRKFTLIAVLLVATVVFYFLLRAIEPSQLDDIMALISSEKPRPVAQTKKVSVNSELDKMMPAKTSHPDPNPVPVTSTPPNLTTNNPADNSATLTATAAETPETQATPETPATQGNASGGVAPAPGFDDSVVDASADVRVLLNASNAPPQPISQGSGETPPSGALRVSRTEAVTPEDQITNLLALGMEAAKNQAFGKAIAAFDAILELDPTRHDVRKRLSVVLYSQNRDKQVVSLLRDGIQLSPDRADLRLMLGRLWHRQKKTRELYEVLQPMDPNVEDNSEYLELKASAATELGLYSEAASLYERLANHSPEQSRWWLGFAIALDKQGNARDALEAYLRASELQQLPASVTEFVNKRIAVLGG